MTKLSELEQNPKIKYLPIPKLRFVWAMVQFPLLRSAQHQLGWFKSAWKNSSVDKAGNPIPWLTYPAIHFLESRSSALKQADVFEFGSGNSTFWWAKKCSSVTSVEYYDKWFEKMKTQLPKKVELLFRENNSTHDFGNAILEDKKKYDIIMVDGRDRVSCAVNAAERLKKGGVIVWDNSERPRYQKGVKKLLALGFKQIEFFGPVPIDNKLEITSIFYKTDNILKI